MTGTRTPWQPNRGRAGSWSSPRAAIPALGLCRKPPIRCCSSWTRSPWPPPRTKRLVGTPSEGQVTYITRSKTIGFPDFTTVKAIPGPDGTRLAVFARLRFGREDFGVNRARVEGWLEALAQPRG